MIVLENNRLKIEIAVPDEIYHGSRFDRSGLITQVTLDGRYTFCGQESLVPQTGSGGMGLCNEFGITQAIGYDETRPGDFFTKLGVGLLKRKDEHEYKFMVNYNVIPFEIELEAGKQFLDISILPIECKGYAAFLRKKISISDNYLKIDYEIENVGKKKILTDEYNHNFISLNKHRVGSDYHFQSSFPMACHSIKPYMKVNPRSISWIDEPNDYFYLNMNYKHENYLPQWKIEKTGAGFGVRELSSFRLKSFAFWGCAHVVCPETFFEIDLPPNNKKSWSRIYEFYS